jgi:hypothetical protein
VGVQDMTCGSAYFLENVNRTTRRIFVTLGKCGRLAKGVL